ncbi:hypothetical protein D3C76_1489720 [compost metagenome]
MLRGIEAAKAERGRLLDGGNGKLVLPVPTGGMGFERLIGKGGGGLHVGLLILGQGKIHLIRFLVVLGLSVAASCQ